MNLNIFNCDLYFVLTISITQRNTKLDRLFALQIGHKVKIPHICILLISGSVYYKKYSKMKVELAE